MDENPEGNTDTAGTGGANATAAQPASSANAEEELAKIKRERDWEKYIGEHTKSGWDAVKANFRWGIFFALVFALNSVLIINDINRHSLEYGFPLFLFCVFAFVEINLAKIRDKLSYFVYLDDDARISESIYRDDQFKNLYSREQIIDKLKTEDRLRVQTLCTGSVLASGIALFSVFSVLQGAKPVWVAGIENLSFWDYFSVIGASFLPLFVLVIATYLSFNAAKDLRKLTKPLRVFK
jgi:hypothetical protein